MPLQQLLKTPIVGLQNWISSSPTFQTLVQAGSEAAALNSVFFQDAVANWTATRAIVGSDGRRTLTKTSTTGWLLDSPLFLALQIDESANFVDGVINHNAAALDFMGKIEAILDDILPLCGTTVGSINYPDIIKIEETQPPLPCDPQENMGKYFWDVMWSVTLRG